MSIVKVAQQAGVSHVTVSRALNDPEKVHPETLARIREACDKLNFTPRVIPSRLKAVSLIVPPTSQIVPGDSILISRLVSRLSGEGFHTLVSSVAGIEKLSFIFRRAFIGLIHSLDDKALPVIRQYAAQAPFVAINDMNEEIGPDAILVGSDHKQGITLAMKHLIERGHKRIAFVSSAARLRGERERLDTYRHIMTEQGALDDTLIFANDEGMLPEGLRRICASDATALLVADGSLTLKVLYYLKLLGKEVPKDLSLVSHEIAGGFEFLYPPITTFVQPSSKIAEVAADLILQKTSKKPKPTEHRHVLPYELVVRESVKNV
jgi:LacI family transcriptional regulator